MVNPPLADARVGITGVGASLPERVLSTADLQRQVEEASGLTLPAGLFSVVTGIDQRRPNSSVERTICETSRSTRCLRAIDCRSSTFRRSVTSS